MFHSTVTRKGQTTIPGPVREALHIQPGDKLEYDIQGSQATIRVHPGIMSLQGVLASSKGEGLSRTNPPGGRRGAETGAWRMSKRRLADTNLIVGPAWLRTTRSMLR